MTLGPSHRDSPQEKTGRHYWRCCRCYYAYPPARSEASSQGQMREVRVEGLPVRLHFLLLLLLGLLKN